MGTLPKPRRIALARRSRALAVIGFSLAIASLATFTLDIPRGLGMGVFALLILTLVTIPDDLEPGEFDRFGIAVLILFFAVGVYALVTEPRQPQHLWTKYDDPCVNGCED